MRKVMKGRVAIIAGGASGIGLAIGNSMAEAGVTVCLADLNGEQAAKEADRLHEKGWNNLFVGAADCLCHRLPTAARTN